MKKALLYFFSFFLSSLAYGQCDELFISEYIEGSAYNKALELYNPTETDIDLSAYRLVRWRNGGLSSSSINYVLLNGIIGAKDVYVVGKDPDAGAGEVVFDQLLCLSDGLYSPMYATGNGLYHNGDDAITLEKDVNGTWVVLDLFGTPNPNVTENGWCDTPPYHGCPLWNNWTEDQTLVRKSSVTHGFFQWYDSTTMEMKVITHNPSNGWLTNFPPFFNPSVEWDSLAENRFDHLGWHDASCAPLTDTTYSSCVVGIKNIDNKIPFQVFPNPLGRDKNLTIQAEAVIEEISLVNILGQVSARQLFSSSDKTITYQVPSSINPGVYLVKVRFEGNQVTIKKLIIE